MEKPVTCTNPKCGKQFKAVGGWDKSKEVPQGITCPHCKEPNQINWPMNMGVAGKA